MTTKKSSSKRHRQPRVGTIAGNFHEGSRSEILADYLFSGWGTVTPSRRQDDYGVDLYCTLTKDLAKRAVVTDYFVVQVKSGSDPWHFPDPESVQWLLLYPIPIFLAYVDKKAGILSVYHVFQRFMVAATGNLPSELELTPKDSDRGSYVPWSGSTKHSLSAPILRVSINDLLDSSKMSQLREVFTTWLHYDRENLELLRNGLLRFRMPDKYQVNQNPEGGFIEQGLSAPNLDSLNKGLLVAAEAVECLGGQLGKLGKKHAALLAAAFVNYIVREYHETFAGVPHWKQRLPGDLGLVNDALNKALEDTKSYKYAAIEAIEKHIFEHPIAVSYLK